MFIRSKTTALLLSLCLYSSTSQAWQLQETDDSSTVQVWTQSVKSSSFKAFRGQVAINAPLAKVLTVIRDTTNIPKWYHNTTHARKLKIISQDQSLNYSIASAPWPVSDRDSVTLVTKKRLTDGGILIELKAQASAFPEQPGLVRIPKLEGYWKLVPISENKTEVTFEVAAEPGGEIPSWLANAMVIDMPFYTLNNLKERVEQELQ